MEMLLGDINKSMLFLIGMILILQLYSDLSLLSPTFFFLKKKDALFKSEMIYVQFALKYFRKIDWAR